MDGECLLDIRGLSKAFGGLQALLGVDIQVAPGEIVSVIGPNGAGKTTLFNLMTGLYRPTRGTILFRGENLAGLPPHLITARGIVRTFQDIRVFANMTVIENVMVGAHARLRASWVGAALRPRWVRDEERRVRERARGLLALFGDRLVAETEARAVNLSYADQRRLEIARALAADPTLILLDEPTAGMTSSETAETMEQIRRIRDSGITVMLIEHKLKVVMAISERVLVLDHGQKLAEGKPDEVRREPKVIEAYLGRA